MTHIFLEDFNIELGEILLAHKHAYAPGEAYHEYEAGRSMYGLLLVQYGSIMPIHLTASPSPLLDRMPSSPALYHRLSWQSAGRQRSPDEAAAFYQDTRMACIEYRS